MVRFISFLSTMTARAPDSNLEEKEKKRKSKTSLIAPPATFFFHSKNLSKQTMTGMKLQSCFRRKEKLTNHLVINVAAHQGLAGTTRPPTCPRGHVGRPGLMAAIVTVEI